MAQNRLWVQVMPPAVGSAGAEVAALPALIAADLIASGVGAIIKSAADGLIASDQFVIKTVLAYEPSFVIRRNATSASFLLTSMWLNVGPAAVPICEGPTRVPRSFDAIRESDEYERSPVVIELELSESADGTALAAHVKQWKYEEFLSPPTTLFRSPKRKLTVEVKVYDVDGGVLLATAMQVQADKTALANVRPNDGERLPWMKRPVKNFPGNRVLDEDQPFGPVNIEVSITEVAEPSRFARFLGATLGSQKAAIEGYVRDRVTGALDETATAKARVARIQEASASRERYETGFAEVVKARSEVERADDASRSAARQSLNLKLATLRQLEILARAAFDRAGLPFEPIPDGEDPASITGKTRRP